MPEKPPPDPAEDFVRRYAQELHYLTGNRMVELDIPTGQTDARTLGKGHACFMPHERTGGGRGPDGGLTLDSGILNPELLGTLHGSQEWAKARLRDRFDAAITRADGKARRGWRPRRVAPACPGRGRRWR